MMKGHALLRVSDREMQAHHLPSSVKPSNVRTAAWTTGAACLAGACAVGTVMAPGAGSLVFGTLGVVFALSLYDTVRFFTFKLLMRHRTQ